MSDSQRLLSPAALAALPWTRQLRLRWGCWLNRKRHTDLEQLFQSLAQTRKRLLLDWAQHQWQHLQNLAELIAANPVSQHQELLHQHQRLFADASELLLINAAGQRLASTRNLSMAQPLPAKAVARGLTAPFLHGPYSDPDTARLGASTSGFHDAVTLMFYQPIPGLGCLCARIPNDVLSDLIQREAGHVFQDSGDHYLFMAQSHFDAALSPGTALSRSRFEDQSFSLGDNLKQGIPTRWGPIQIRNHTELELVFTDPATGQLHHGIAQTIARGHSLEVRCPGYACNCPAQTISGG